MSHNLYITSNSDSGYLNYISYSDYNFNISLLNIPEAVSFFNHLDKQIQDILKHLNSLSDLTAKDSFYFISAFFLIAQRQMRNAFTLFLRKMSYDGMLVFRIALETTVFAYRIFKEPKLLEVWANKNNNFKEFSQKFRRDKYPEDMPFRDEIEKQINLLNDYWAHPNINYFSTTLESVKNKNEFRIHFFDHKDKTFNEFLLTFLNYCLKTLEIFRKILEERFKVFLTSTESDYLKIIEDFEKLKLIP